MSENLIGSTTAVFPIRLSVAVASPVDVEWATRDGSAVAGSDYKETAGTVTFLPGETEKQIEVQVYGQAITPADDKVFFIRLNPPSNAVLVDAILTCTINIIDDQGIPSVAVVVAEGRRGPKGDPGLSAYEQAVLMGYTGTLAEWMDQIADASKAADRAGDYAISASEDALKAQNAAKNAVFAGVVFPTAAEGVDPILGVNNGAYFNVRSPLSEHYIDEYQNVNGVAVATGKSYPTSEHFQNISEHTALPFVDGTSYNINRRVFLADGAIVKSTIYGNANDPNVDMAGWVKTNSASQIMDESGLGQQDFNNYIGRRWFNTSFSKGMKILMPNGTPVISRVNNNAVDPSIDFSNWATEDNCVRPEMFDDRAGLSNDPDIDTPAFKKAVATGRFVRLTSGRNYKLKEEVTPNNGAPLVVFGDKMGTGETGATISAASGFAGYMLKPKTGYDIRDVRIVGSGIDGCFPIGNDADSSAGLARIERYYFSNCDIGINFGDKWEHPWGLYYNQIVGLSCRTGGINLGGNSGGAAASSGESAWSMDNILLIASSAAGDTGSGGIEATGIVITPNITSTTDKISWNNAVTPYYGWCVMRSANGATNWHVPPNWTSDNYTAGEFTASKSSGETWNYKVVRMTKGLNIRRAKAINIGVAQCEYFGIGTQLTEVFNATLGQSYAESRERTIPLPNFCSIRLNNAALTLHGGWCEKSSYGISVWANSVLSLSGTFRAGACVLAKAQIGGSTQQQMYINKLNATNGTPDLILGSGSIYDYAIKEDKYYDDGIHTHVDGANSSGFHIARRGVAKGKLAVETSGLSVVESDTARINVINKALTPSFANESTTSPLTSGSATKFLTLANIAPNSGGVAKFDVLLFVRDGSFVARQVSAGTLKVQYLRAASGDVVSSVTQETTILNQQGTLNSVVYSVVGSASSLEVYANVNTTLSSSICSIQLIPLSIIGASARSVSVIAT